MMQDSIQTLHLNYTIIIESVFPIQFDEPLLSKLYIPA